jgi:hypothetical protein
MITNRIVFNHDCTDCINSTSAIIPTLCQQVCVADQLVAHNVDVDAAFSRQTVQEAQMSIAFSVVTSPRGETVSKSRS